MSIKLEDGATVVLRYGGWGDLFPVVCAARWMREKFPDRPVDAAVRGKEQVEFLRGLGVFRAVYEQVVDMGGRWVEWDLGVDGLHPGYAPLQRLPDAYDLVVDFRDTVENNPFADHGNWYDLSLSFAGFDPAEVPPEMKRPFVRLEEKHRKGAHKAWRAVGGGREHRPRVVLALAGSAPLRSMPREFWQAVVDRVGERVPGATFIVLSGPEKAGLAPTGPRVKNLVGKTKMIESAWVLAHSDLAVCADTGLAHFAEGLGVDNITCYTTVRGWTRSMYHKYTHVVDTPLDCQCAALVALCPRIAQKIMEPMNGIQRRIFEMRHIQPTPEPVIAERLNMSRPALEAESKIVEAYRKRIHGEFAPCVHAIDVDVVVDKAVEILEGKRGNGCEGIRGVDGTEITTCAAVSEARA